MSSRAKGFKNVLLGNGWLTKELGSYILGLYGISEWLDDISKNRSYWQEGEGIVHSILDKLSTSDFGDFVKEYGVKWSDADEYRQRHLIRAINNKSLF